MKKILSILGIISFIISGSSNLIGCNNTPTLTSEELSELKEKNSKTINGNKLEWIAPQEKPFDTVDNKWYVVIWRRGDENNDWRIAKFQNNTFDRIKIDDFNNKKLQIFHYFGRDLFINSPSSLITYVSDWNKDNGTYFKAFYRWDGDGETSIPKINGDREITN